MKIIIAIVYLIITYLGLKKAEKKKLYPTRTVQAKISRVFKSKARALILVAARWAVHRWNQGRAGFNKNLRRHTCYPPAFILRGT